jgi:hypothetical protein
MSGFSLIWVAIIIFRVLSSAKGGRGSGNITVRWRWIVWGTVVAGWVMGSPIVISAWAFALSTTGRSLGPIVVALVLSLAFVFVGVVLLSPWPVLRAIARRGNARLVCTLAHVSLVFFRTGETGSAATLLAALALSHRGSVTGEERAWLEKRLRRGTRFLGTFAAAHAFTYALEGRALREAGRFEDAREWEETARVLLGTVSYMSKAGVPAPVRRLVHEYLALDSARLGLWGGVHVPPEVRPTKVHRVLHGWASERFFASKDDEKPPKPFRTDGSPLADALAERPREATRIESAKDAHVRASRVYAALWKGEAVAPRDVLNMLMAMDVLTHPESTDTVLPEELRGDEAQVNAIHDELASAVAQALTRCDVPLHALPRYGPVSARVHQKVESALLGEWSRTIAQVEERRATYERRDGYGEWLEVSRVRRLYRRIEYCLGEPTVARLWPQFAYSYGNLGVRLSESLPRMRPLAHAVFAVMAREAERFQDLENVQRQASNMKITSGTE